MWLQGYSGPSKPIKKKLNLFDIGNPHQLVESTGGWEGSLFFN